MKTLRSKRGFTLTEVIVAGLIVAITAGGTFSAYILAHYFASKFKHRAMATNRVAEIADYLRYRYAYDGKDASGNPSTLLDIGEDKDISAIADPSTWDLNNEVNNLNVSYDVARVWFVNGIEQDTDPNVDGDGNPDTPKPMKKITTKISWNERKAN